LKNKKINKKILFGGLIALIVGVFAVYALTNYESWTINKVSTGGLNASIVEKYTEPDSVYPSETIDKVVNVKNTGSIDALVRVSLTKAWGSSRDSEGNLVVDSSLSADNIIINFNNIKKY
jgi:alternate signal-mediated exported protein